MGILFAKTVMNKLEDDGDPVRAAAELAVDELACASGDGFVWGRDSSLASPMRSGEMILPLDRWCQRGAIYGCAENGELAHRLFFSDVGDYEDDEARALTLYRRAGITPPEILKVATSFEKIHSYDGIFLYAWITQPALEHAIGWHGHFRACDLYRKRFDIARLYRDRISEAIKKIEKEYDGFRRMTTAVNKLMVAYVCEHDIDDGACGVLAEAYVRNNGGCGAAFAT